LSVLAQEFRYTSGLLEGEPMRRPGTSPRPNPPHGLPPTARRLVAAARRILVRDGFNAITVEAVAVEAGAYRDSVRYYFGSKSGLLAAVVDAISTDQSAEGSRDVRELPPGPERVHALVDADRRLAADSAAFQDFFRLLPHVLQDDELRSRVAALYGWYREQYLRAFGDADSEEAGRDLQNYASLMVAVIDGLAIQKALDPGGLDLDDVFDLWERLLRTAGRLASPA
jgi:AcrR family transcriptional regulator